MSTALRRGAWVVFAAAGTGLWVSAALSWALWAHYLALGWEAWLAAPPFELGRCLGEGAPPPPRWTAPALVSGGAFALAGLLADVRRARRAAMALTTLACVAVIATLIGWVATVEAERSSWVAARFGRGDPFAPWLPLQYQLEHTRGAALVLAILGLVAATASLVWRLPARATGLGASFAVAAAGVALFFLVGRQRGAPPSEWLPTLASAARLGGLAAAAAVAVIGTLEARRGLPPRALQLGFAAAWLTLGAAARLATASYDVDMASPPSLTQRPSRIPPSSGPERPWVRACRPPRPTVAECSSDGALEAVLWIDGAPDPTGARVAAAVDSGRPPILSIAADRPSADTRPLRASMEAALRAGVAEADLSVRRLRSIESATYGTIHDWEWCVITAPLSQLVGAPTYGAMLDRAGAEPAQGPLREGRTADRAAPSR